MFYLSKEIFAGMSRDYFTVQIPPFKLQQRLCDVFQLPFVPQKSSTVFLQISWSWVDVWWKIIKFGLIQNPIWPPYWFL